MRSVGVLDTPLYTVAEAARLLRVPPSTLVWWLEGRGHRGAGQSYPPVIRPEPTGSSHVTWGEYVEAGYLREYRRRHRVPLQQLRAVIDALRQEFGVPYPLAHFKPFVGPGRRLVLAIEERLEIPAELRMVTTVQGRQLLTPPADSFLERVEFAQDDPQWARRVYPAGKASSVVIDPEFNFGAPTVNGISTEVLAELVDAGEPMEEVAQDYGLALPQLRQALAYEWVQAAA